MVVLGEKLRWISRSTQSGWEVEPRALFLRSSASVQLSRVSVKGCRVKGPPAGSVRVAYVDWRGKRTCRVYQVSLTGCTLIQIAATLRYE
jgi:hypothetical protein